MSVRSGFPLIDISFYFMWWIKSVAVYGACPNL